MVGETMYFKIDYNKVSDLGAFLKNKSEELDTLYDDILKLCDEIETNYVSLDSSIYLSKFRGYVNTFIDENVDLKKGGLVLERISNRYNNQEERWAKRVMQDDLNKRRS